MKKISSPRLKSFSYTGSFAYSLTLCTHKRMPYLKSSELVSKIVDRLKYSTNKYGFDVVVYTFMPDHFHLLIKGADDSDLKRFMRHFKQTSGYDFKMRTGKSLWHISYYDHVLRKEDDLLVTARYILENPVRKEFVKDFRDYSFSGSFVFDIREML